LNIDDVDNEDYNVIWVDCYDPSDEELLQLSKNIGI